MSAAHDDGLRIDKWLWFTRFFKTRSQATDAVRGGHVKLNGERPKPGARVSRGDRLSITRRQLTWDVEVVDVPARRGPASEAQACYVEDEASVERRESTVSRLRGDRLLMPMTPGKPDKRTRRALRDRSRRSDS